MTALEVGMTLLGIIALAVIICNGLDRIRGRA